MSPPMTASGVRSSVPLGAEDPDVAEEPDDRALVAEDRLPRQRADEEVREERHDDEAEQHVLEPPAAERDDVRERVAR